MSAGVYELYLAVAPNGMGYVGCTKHTVAQRWAGHRPSWRHDGAVDNFDCAMTLFGKEAFEVVHIASAVGAHDAAEVETLLIAQHGTRWPSGYNRSARSNVARYTAERPKPVKPVRDWIYIKRGKVAWPPHPGAAA